MLWPWENVIWIERVSSERPVNGLSEQGSEALDLLASLREIDRAVSYGVLFRVSESIHGVQAPNCLGVAGARSAESWAIYPSPGERPAKLRERGLLLGLIGGGDAGCFYSLYQAQSTGRTANG
jgi:hypothetical protein